MKLPFAIALYAMLFGLAADAQTLQSGGGIPSGPVTLTGSLTVPAGTISVPGLGVGTAANGIFAPSGNTLEFVSNTAGAIEIFGGTCCSIIAPSTGVWGYFASTFGGSIDTGMSRTGPGIVAIGNGTASNTAGIIQTGTASLVSLTTGTNADFLCLGATGTVFLQTTACTISSLRFKPDWKPYADNALRKVVNMEVGTFHVDIPNRDPNAGNLQAGLNAENVAKIAPECAVYEDDMKTPKSYRQECVIGLLVKAIQQLKNDR